jgi:hypothetical protein
MNASIVRIINSDIRSVRQYLDLASRTIQRAESTLQAEQITATQQERIELALVADQCRAEYKLIDRAIDGMQGVDTITEPEVSACIS